MTLEAIGGKVQSEPLNRNFSYLDSRIREINNKIEKTKFKDLKEPFYICHRGALHLFPENTLEAFQGCLALGNPFIEMDVQTLADGSLGVMHDTTVDRTTDKTGRVDDYSAMGFRNLKIDVLPSYKAVTAPLFEDVVATLGKAAIYCPESKDRKSVPKIVETLKRYDLKEYSLIQSFDIDDLQYAIDEGFETLFLTDSYSPGEIKARGINYVGVSTTASDSYIQSCIENGLKVLVYTVNRRYVRDEYLKKGVSGFFTDDPFYLSGSIPTLTDDPFQNQTYYHGMLANYTTNRGAFFLNRWGFDTIGSDRDFVLQGWAGELPATFTLEYTMTIDENVINGWGSVVVCAPIDYFDDNKTNLSNGYHCLIGAGGTLSLYVVQNGSSTLVNTAKSTAIADGENATLKIEVTSTTVTFSRIDDGSNASITATNSLFRNGYFFFGRKWLRASFSNVSIT